MAGQALSIRLDSATYRALKRLADTAYDGKVARAGRELIERGLGLIPGVPGVAPRDPNWDRGFAAGRAAVLAEYRQLGRGDEEAMS